MISFIQAPNFQSMFGSLLGGMPGGAIGGPDVMSFFNNPALMNMVCLRIYVRQKHILVVFLGNAVRAKSSSARIVRSFNCLA